MLLKFALQRIGSLPGGRVQTGQETTPASLVTADIGHGRPNAMSSRARHNANSAPDFIDTFGRWIAVEKTLGRRPFDARRATLVSPVSV